MNFIDKKLDFSKHIINGLTSELKGYYLYKKYAEDKNSVLFVTSNLYEANIIYQTILNYTSDVHFFPMDDFLTSEALAISPEFKLTRLNTLNSILTEKRIVITNLMGFLRYLPIKEDLFNSALMQIGLYFYSDGLGLSINTILHNLKPEILKEEIEYINSYGINPDYIIEGKATNELKHKFEELGIDVLEESKISELESLRMKKDSLRKEANKKRKKVEETKLFLEKFESILEEKKEIK